MSVDVKPKPVERRPLQWFNVRGKGVGFWAYVVMRLSALGLVLYLFLHLVILSQLAIGPAAWDGFVATAKSPVFLLLDIVLIVGMLAGVFMSTGRTKKPRNRSSSGSKRVSLFMISSV